MLESTLVSALDSSPMTAPSRFSFFTLIAIRLLPAQGRGDKSEAMLKGIIGFIQWLRLLVAPKVVFVRRFSGAIGDNLLMTVVLPHVRAKYPSHTVVVESNRPELFCHNPYVDVVTPYFADWISIGRRFVSQYVVVEGTESHLTEQLLAPFGVAGRGAPELYLTEGERRFAAARFAEPYLTLCPNAKTSWAANRKN